MKLKDIRKGDTIIMFKTTGDHTEEVPHKVTNIEFQDKKVWDLQLVNKIGSKKHYAFLDWNTEVKTGEMPDDVCPCCGRAV